MSRISHHPQILQAPRLRCLWPPWFFQLTLKIFFFFFFFRWGGTINLLIYFKFPHAAAQIWTISIVSIVLVVSNINLLILIFFWGGLAWVFLLKANYSTF